MCVSLMSATLLLEWGHLLYTSWKVGMLQLIGLASAVLQQLAAPSKERANMYHTQPLVGGTFAVRMRQGCRFLISAFVQCCVLYRSDMRVWMRQSCCVPYAEATVEKLCESCVVHVCM